MAKTYLDELIDYPAKVIQKICSSNECLALLLNKNINDITEDDIDIALEQHIFDYEYLDDTMLEAQSFIWVEIDIPDVSNKHIKDVRLYITVACHKQTMKINSNIIKGVGGNRRDNLVRYIDKILNNNKDFGIGKLKLEAVRSVTSSNQSFTLREISYEISDFNIKEQLSAQAFGIR